MTYFKKFSLLQETATIATDNTNDMSNPTDREQEADNAWYNHAAELTIDGTIEHPHPYRKGKNDFQSRLLEILDDIKCEDEMFTVADFRRTIKELKP